jgi:alpha-beta hydrolase superfamily lysophospholipase
VLVVVIIFHAAGGWYFSDQLRTDGFEVRPHVPEFRATLAEVGTDSVVITQGDPADGELFNDGLYGLVWAGGYGTVGTVMDQSESRITRSFNHLGGDPPQAGTAVDVDPWIFPDDFADATPMPVEHVTYLSPLGAMDAVLIRGTTDTWAVLVHGKNASPRETLRMAEPLWEGGVTVLSITHRNDEGQPSDPSGLHRYGTTEWEDLDGAVDYALAEGANRLVVGGLSTGAAVVLSYLERSDTANSVVGVVLDSPNIDFGATVDHNAAARSLPMVGLPVPPTLTWVAKAIGSLRFGIDWGQIDYVSRAVDLNVPILILHGTEDPSVPIETSRDLAELRPDLVTLIEFEGAKHVQSWNLDPAKYTEAIASFIENLA